VQGCDHPLLFIERQFGVTAQIIDMSGQNVRSAVPAAGERDRRVGKAFH